MAADGRKVTRSTSPIDEKIIRTIFVEDANPNRKNSASFTIPVHSSSSSSSGQGKRSLQSASFPTTASSSKKPSLEQFLQSRLAHSSAPPSSLDPSNPNYYGELIRERLRMILNRNRRGPQPQPQAAHPYYDNDDNDDDEEREGAQEGEQDYYPPVPVPGIPRRKRGGSAPSLEQRGNKLDETQLYTRDMMASMATIMTAVGGILTNTNQKQFWASQKRKWQSKSNYHHHNNNSKNNKEEITEQEAEAMTKILTSDLDDGKQHNANKNNKNNNNNIQSSVLSSIPNKPLNLLTRAGTKDFLLEMSDFIQKKEELPKNKSKVVDMIMQKLQVSEIEMFFLFFLLVFLIRMCFFLVH
jgi:hypothetical protein